MVIAEEVMDFVSKFKVVTDVSVQDSADRMNYLYTVAVLLVCGCIATVKQYLLKPISCYLPTHPTSGNIIEFVEYLCWVDGSIAYDLNEQLPQNNDDWNKLYAKKPILYYQWVPFVLGIQCLLFYLPRLVWQLVCHSRSGTDLQHLMNTASDAVRADVEARNKMVTQMARTLEDVLYKYRGGRNSNGSRFMKNLRSMCQLTLLSRRLGTWLVLAYMAMKICYLGNSLGQLYLMQRFLNFNSSQFFFGVDVLRNIISGEDWKQTLVFPRVTFCRARVQHVGAVNDVAAQCVLPVNMLNEKIYIFLWFWIVATLFVNILSVPVWFARIGLQDSHVRFIKSCLKTNQLCPPGKDRHVVEKFTHQFLRYDGVFLLRMIALNSGDLITADLVAHVWNSFKKKYKDYGFFNDGKDHFDYLGGGPEGDSDVGVNGSGLYSMKPLSNGKLSSQGNQTQFQRHPSAPPEVKSPSARPVLSYQDKEIL